MDQFVVPTIACDLVFVLVIIRLARRELVWINLTANPTAEWVARQITEAFPWDETPRYLIRDRDQAQTHRDGQPCEIPACFYRCVCLAALQRVDVVGQMRPRAGAANPSNRGPP